VTGPTAEEIRCLGALPAQIDCARVRVHRAPSRLRSLVLWASRGRAVTLGNHVFMPDRCAGDLAVLAHELTHCGQYQRWGALRYFVHGAVAQLRELLFRRFGVGRSPYVYRLETGKPFDAYGMEQQGQIVEDSFRGDVQALAVSPYRPGNDQETPSA
jgi:uncharacterized protein DUF4157